MSIENIEKVLAQADKTDLSEGMVAYTNYNLLLLNISKIYGVGFAQTVAAFVSLSPNNDYVGNLRSLVSLIQGIKAGKPVESITISPYKHCLLRAYDYMTGTKDFLLETGGLKIKNFYCNILLPESKGYVTIDGHMHNVWRGKQTTMRESMLSQAKYDKISSDFKTVASRKKIIPNQLQAILWFTWKRINRVRYKPQTCLFSADDDFWGLKIDPADIKPF